MAKKRKISANVETYLSNLQSFLIDIDQQKVNIASDVSALEQGINTLIETNRKDNNGDIDAEYEMSKKFDLFDKKMAAMRNITSLLQEEAKALGKHSDFIKSVAPNGGGESEKEHHTKDSNTKDMMNKIHEALKQGNLDDKPQYEER